jgi:hypothetical protein
MTTDSQIDDALADLSVLIIDFLPGPAPGYQVLPNSFQGIARSLEIQKNWTGPSKRLALTQLVSSTFKADVSKFHQLIWLIVSKSAEMRTARNPLTKQDIEEIRNCLQRLSVSIPELDDRQFVDKLPGTKSAQATRGFKKPSAGLLATMREELVTIVRTADESEEKGYEFEVFLNKLFVNSGITPRAPFRMQNDFITGWIDFNGAYMINAYWHTPPEASNLIALQHSLEHQADVAGALLISLTGFPRDVQNALSTGTTTKLIAIDLRDIFLILDGGIHMERMLTSKMQAAAEGKSYVLMQDLLV